jgi:hypothetical protein
MLIDYKHTHNALKHILNPRKNMIYRTKMDQFFEELQVITSSKTSCNGKMCKEK